jgi:hypothetical protein
LLYMHSASAACMPQQIAPRNRREGARSRVRVIESRAHMPRPKVVIALAQQRHRRNRTRGSPQ